MRRNALRVILVASAVSLGCLGVSAQEPRPAVPSDHEPLTARLMQMLADMGAKGITPGPELTAEARQALRRLLLCRRSPADPASAAAYHIVEAAHADGFRFADCDIAGTEPVAPVPAVGAEEPRAPASGSLGTESSSEADPESVPASSATAPSSEPAAPHQGHRPASGATLGPGAGRAAAAPAETTIPTARPESEAPEAANNIRVARALPLAAPTHAAYTPGEFVFWLERVDCVRSISAFLLTHAGVVESISGDVLTVRITERRAARFSRSAEGIDPSDWRCEPRRRFCHGPVSFDEFDGRHQLNDLTEVNVAKAWPRDHGLVGFIARTIRERCG